MRAAMGAELEVSSKLDVVSLETIDPFLPVGESFISRSSHQSSSVT